MDSGSLFLRLFALAIAPLLLVGLIGCPDEEKDALASLFPILDDHDWPDPAPTLAPDPDWVSQARIAGADIDSGMTGPELVALLEERAAQNASVVELDSALSQYLTDEQFEVEARFLDAAAQVAHRLGMRAVVYYPSLELLTEDGDGEHTAAKDHPDWLQRGIDGVLNVFSGSLEVWVKAGEESAWADPNGPYREVYLGRVQRLAQTQLDGVWVDVPLFMDTGAVWPSSHPASNAAFTAWSKQQGLGGVDGYAAPKVADMADAGFRAWIRWRHENLADFQKAIADAAHETRADFWVIVETFPLDYLDATDKGLDGAFRRDTPRFTRVWEVDSVSNTKGMLWARPEDFTSKIAMNKYARAADREQPTWVFSYGFQPGDAGLVMSAAVASGARPFECQTPEMTRTVDSAFRTHWFDWLTQQAPLFADPTRHARVGVWYSSASRDYLDYNEANNGLYGMYITTDPKDPDPTWWSTSPDDSAVDKPHIGGWRGAANALVQLKVPFKAVLTPGDPAGELKGLEMLWLPSVAALSDGDAALIKSFAAQGGLVLATGAFPGTLDELGTPRPMSVLAGLFGPEGEAADPGTNSRVKRVGKGLAAYRKDLLGRELFIQNMGEQDAGENVFLVEQLLRIHLEDEVVMDDNPWVLVETARVSEDVHRLYVVDFSGLKEPFVLAKNALQLGYRPPEGKRVAAATVSSPDPNTTQGVVDITQNGDSLFEFSLDIERFAVVELTLEDAPAPVEPPPYAGPVFTDPAHQEAVDDALNFIRTKMRDNSLAAPWKYGVYTNLLETEVVEQRYAHGHLVTSEHMGLMLRATACLGHEEAYGEAFEFVREGMVSPLFQVINWTVDPATGEPLLQQDEVGEAWRNGNAPLDDFRAIRGLIAGASQAGQPAGMGLAERLMRGMYWTSVTDRARTPKPTLPAYPGGVVGYAFNFEESDDPQSTPPAIARGIGELDSYIIPVDYQDTWTMGYAARWDPRWAGVVADSVDLMLAAEIDNSGRFYNGYNSETKQWIGDFENPENAKGQHLKTIQELWTALHLARASKLEILDADRREKAAQAAERTLGYFKGFYTEHARVPEYITFAGIDVADCGGADAPPDCLVVGFDNLWFGEARIYALLGRLALVLDDNAFADQLINEQIMVDRVTDRASVRFGAFGRKTVDDGDAEAWNVLESVLTICLAAGGS